MSTSRIKQFSLKEKEEDEACFGTCVRIFNKNITSGVNCQQSPKILIKKKININIKIIFQLVIRSC